MLKRPIIDNLVYPLFFLFLLLIPWTKLEIIRSITWAEPVFLVLFMILAISIVMVHRDLLAQHTSARNLVIVLIAWIGGGLLSVVDAQFLSPFAFGLVGFSYLAVVCYLCLSLSQSEERFEQVYLWLKISIFVVAAIGTLGLIVAVISGSVGRVFFAAEDALVATFRKPNQFAGFLTIFIPLAWEELKLAKYLYSKILYGLMLAMMTVSMLFSNSKSGLVALIFILAIYLAVFLYRSKYRALLIVGGISLAVYVLGLLLADSVPLIGRIYSEMTEFIKQGQFTDDWRIKNWSMGIELFMQHPITGIGLANTHILHVNEIHNTYLAVLVEMGLVGFAALVALFGLSVYTAFSSMKLADRLGNRAYKALARAQLIGLSAFLLFATQHMMMRQRYLWIALGLIFALNWLLKKKSQALSPSGA